VEKQKINIAKTPLCYSIAPFGMMGMAATQAGDQNKK
jgi:hypothetical protein